MGSGDIQSPLDVRDVPRKYAHIFRRKKTWELVMISGAVCGVELCYAAETAFIGPILLGLGIPISFVALAMCLSPAVGFFVTPLLGSMSDTCASRIGRRRPFIALFAMGMLLGLILLPNGQDLGILLGDSGVDEPDDGSDVITEGNSTNTLALLPTNSTTGDDAQHIWSKHGWGIAFTIVGFVFLDMCCDGCQSPARSYVLDVTTEADHARALSMFTVLSGLSGAIGYVMGGIDWESTAVGASLGGHVKTVFGIVGAFFVGCIVLTLSSFREMPLHVVRAAKAAGFFERDKGHGGYERFTNDDDDASGREEAESVELARRKPTSPSKTRGKDDDDKAALTLKDYFLSIIYMPRTMMILCLTNLFCWMALVSYSLFLTDFVGAIVYGGDPVARMGTESYRVYQSGVRLGCFGLAIDSVTCAIYSMFIEKLVRRFGAKPVYILGQAVYSVSVAMLAMFRTKAAVLLVSPSAGLLYATQFTMPFILVDHYHSSGMIEADADWSERGLGTDIALVSSMMFPAQLLLSLCAGPMVRVFGGSPTVIMYGASLVSACGAVCATRVTYHRL